MKAFNIEMLRKTYIWWEFRKFSSIRKWGPYNKINRVVKDNYDDNDYEILPKRIGILLKCPH